MWFGGEVGKRHRKFGLSVYVDHRLDYRGATIDVRMEEEYYGLKRYVV